MEPIKLYRGGNCIVRTPLSPEEEWADFGPGFYLVGDIDSAREQACWDRFPGYVSTFDFDAEDLDILDLREAEDGLLAWVALLVDNREFAFESAASADNADALCELFLPELDDFDAVIGWRADGSNFSAARKFLDGALSYESFEQAIRKTDGAAQWALLSDEAIEKLAFAGSEFADDLLYYPQFAAKDLGGRFALNKITAAVEEGTPQTYVAALIKERG